MRKEEQTLKEFLESIPVLEKSELGVLRGGFGAIHGGNVSDPMGNSGNCGDNCGCNNNGCNSGCNGDCNNNCGINCDCENPYCHLIKPESGDYSLALSFM